MSNESRKASDVILELESKINTLLGLAATQDLLMKLLSNKLNDLILVVNAGTKPVTKQVTIEAVDDSPKLLPISNESKLPIQELPTGFRRTSRPETYSGDNAFLQKSDQGVVKFPMQLPNAQKEAEVIMPSPAEPEEMQKQVLSNAIPVMQRVVDKTGKSIFLADVEVFNNGAQKPLFKSRTNGTGKWMATLAPGEYKVVIRKRESLTKEKLESTQDIVVNSDVSPLELQTLIMR